MRGQTPASGSASVPVPVDAERVTWQVHGRPIIEGVDLHAPAGRVTGLIGPNGSGKSTLLRCLAGTLTPSAGRVLLDGDDLATLRRRTIARTVAVVEQNLGTDVDLRVRDVVALGRLPHRSRLAPSSPLDEDACATALGQVGLTGFADRTWRTLSGGEQQRVHIARALAQEPAVLLLDEPTNHLDVEHQFQLLDILEGTGLTVVIVLHDLALAARYCERLVLLRGGRVDSHGAVADVLTARAVERVFRVRAEVTTDRAGTALRLLGSARTARAEEQRTTSTG